MYLFPNSNLIRHLLGEFFKEFSGSEILAAAAKNQRTEEGLGTTWLVRQTDIENVTERQLRVLHEIPVEKDAETLEKLLAANFNGGWEIQDL
jgi:hypothetical protein